MICPFCASSKTSVVATIKGLENRRFRRCNACNKTFETKEKVLIKPLDFGYLNGEYKEYIDEEKKIKNEI
ncbi:NrdR family transcriptional regulator [Campylobacter fetus]|uniref:NrdR family transcriptional regulator n=1 Tax=Campylobacter fetus TaxID=196 RepID=UPI003AF40EF1